MAVAVMLLPFSTTDYHSFTGKQLMPYHMLGGALVNGIISTLLSQLGVGLAMPFALWGVCGVLAAVAVRQVSVCERVWGHG
jgi:hypothetical protein